MTRFFGMPPTEAFSRALIDAQLAEAGWKVTDGVSVRFEETLSDGKRADYVLCDRHGRALAVVEAKRTSRNAADAAEQAVHYARVLDVPFVFLANGREVRCWEWQQEAHPRPVATFFSQADLERRAASRVLRRDLLAVPLDKRIAGREYRIDRDRIVDEVRVGNTGATEILFLKYMLDNLSPGGRCGVIVPEGVLFGSTSAHRELRRMLVENHTVEAVLSLPGGVFQPYSGVKTSVLFFRQGGRTDQVLFLHADNDGYKLDANHDQPIEADDLPALADTFRRRDARWAEWHALRIATDDGKQWDRNWWYATADELRASDYNLSASRFRPLSQQQAEHRDPRELLDELAAIELEIAGEVEALRELLR